MKMCGEGRESVGQVEGCIARGAGRRQEVVRRVRSNAVGSQLIRVCVACGRLGEAMELFEGLPQPNVFVWSAIISAHAKLGENERAFDMFCQMQASVKPDAHVFVAVLQACSNWRQGKLIESQVVESGFYSHLIVRNSLIHMYVNCGCLDAARQVFNRFSNRSVVTWSAMISGYARHGYGEEALQLFQHMQYQSMALNQVTFVCVLKACSTLPKGKIIHVHIISSGMESDIVILNSLIDMYAKCGSFSGACSVFDRSSTRNVVTWSAMIGGCVHHGRFKEALKLFKEMQDEGTEPNEITFISILKACSMLATLDAGKLIHCFLIERHFHFHGTIGNTLIDMYSKSGSLEDAFDVFDRLPKGDVVTWSAMMVACSRHGCDEEALQLFQQMRQAGTDPDQITFACTMKACSNIAALDQGRMIHGYLVKYGTLFELSSSNTLIDMYVKCGSLEDACRVFDRSRQHSVATWNTIILGCSESCEFKLAKQYFGAMQQQGIKPNSVTFSCLLLMCSHMGLLNEGFCLFKLMGNDHGISPGLDHFVSLVHLLGHTGYLDEAKCLLATMPFGPGVVGWRSLLSQCKAHSNVELGQQCFEHIALGDQREAAGYVLMSTMYVQPSMEETADEVEELRKYVNAWKKPAKAFIEVCGKVHSFNVGGGCHPQINDVYVKLRRLGVQMFEEGYMHRW